MVVIGPSYSEEKVDEIYNDFLSILKEKYHVQNSEHLAWKEDRVERNADFREAIRRLVELDCWEGF